MDLSLNYNGNKSNIKIISAGLIFKQFVLGNSAVELLF